MTAATRLGSPPAEERSEMRLRAQVFGQVASFSRGSPFSYLAAEREPPAEPPRVPAPPIAVSNDQAHLTTRHLALRPDAAARAAHGFHVSASQSLMRLVPRHTPSENRTHASGSQAMHAG